jgi:hypothetical protein
VFSKFQIICPYCCTTHNYFVKLHENYNYNYNYANYQVTHDVQHVPFLSTHVGILLISLALCADAVIGNVQEKSMKSYNSTNSEVVSFTQIYEHGIYNPICKVWGNAAVSSYCIN